MGRNKTWRYGAPRCSTGVALITVMMILALMATFAAYLVEDNHIAIRHIANQRDVEAAHQLAVGGEEVAAFLIENDGAQDNLNGNNQIDYYGEIWSLSVKEQGAQGERTIKPKSSPFLTNEPVGNGTVSVMVTDATAKFNINNLALKPVPDPNNPVTDEQTTPYYDAFVLLISEYGLGNDFASAVTDWIDSDSQPYFFNGAEDDVYTAFDQPYRAANAPFSDVSELRLINNFDEIDEAKQRRLLDLLTALPVGYVGAQDKAVTINLNTAPAQLIRLLRVHPGGDANTPAEPLSMETAESIVAVRAESGPFITVEDFKEKMTEAGLGLTFEILDRQSGDDVPSIKRLFDVRSEFFDVETTVTFGRFDYRLLSTIRRYSPGDSPRPAAGVMRRKRQLLETKKAS